MADIQKELQNIYDALSKEYTVLGVFLYGSQNYNLATEDSDIDTKAIVVPSLRDLVFKQPVSRVIKFEHGECDVKDIREMISNYKKQNVNFIETLFTTHYIVSPAFEQDVAALRVHREKISRLDEKRALACMNGLMQQSLKRMVNRTDATAEDIDRYGYHRKSLMNVCKMAEMISKYTRGFLYKDVLDCSIAAPIRTAVYTKEKAISFAKRLNQRSAEATVSYLEKNTPSINDELTNWLDEWVYEIIMRNMPI